MGKGLRVHVTNGQDGSTFERVFEDFPVRIGRDGLNELPLDFPFVSKFHAVVDLRGDVLVLRDLGSRNGTSLQVPTERIPPNEPIDLAASQNGFGIGTLRFSVGVVATEDVSTAGLRRRRGGAILSHEPLTGPAATIVDAAAGAGHPSTVADVYSGIDAWRLAWGKLYTHLSTALGAMPAEERARFLAQVVQEHPALAQEPDFRRIADHLGARVEPAATNGATPLAAHGTREEAAALLVLRDLAGWYVDADRPPQTVAQLVSFGRKLQDVLDAFFVSFVPLREGLRRFEEEFDVKVATQTATPHRSPAASAQTPAELAARLLDWNDASDGARVIKRAFADLMVHNVSLVNGVMRGAGALLEQLSPAKLEEELEGERARGAGGGFSVGPWRFKALWDVLKRRHDDLSNEEQERFALLFGAEFARAYTTLTKETRLAQAGGGGAGGKKDERRRVKTSSEPQTQPPPAPAPVTPKVGPTGTAIVAEARRGTNPRGDR